MNAKFTPGPWGIVPVERDTLGTMAIPPLHARFWEVGREPFGTAPSIAAVHIEADARLIAAAPAFALVWSMVPDEIRQRIFDALHKPDTEWVEAALAKATGA